MNSRILIEAKKIIKNPGLYEIEDAWRLYNLGIALSKQIEETICQNADIGIRRLFHNIIELRDLYNQENSQYLVYLKVANNNDIIEEALTAVSETIHGLLKLAFYYYAREATFFVNEYKEHCKHMYRAIKELPPQEYDITKYRLQEESILKQADYYRLLMYTGVLDRLKRPTDIETAMLINPEELNKNIHVLSSCNLELFFLYYKVANFNIKTARTTIEKIRNKKITNSTLTQPQLNKIKEILNKLNKEQ